jgi:DNA-binding transcriptional ArsR family regulator
MGSNHSARKPGRRPAQERTQTPEVAPSYPTKHRVRQEALILLHEGEFSAGDIAELIGEETAYVANHLRDLYDAGCIEFVGHEGEGNFRRAVYRAVERPMVEDETFQAMSRAERQETIEPHLQWTLTECLAAYQRGKMATDENLCLMSDEPNLDEQGREELRRLLTAVWDGSEDVLAELQSVQEIAARAANRMARSGEEGTTVVVSLMAFERVRHRSSRKSSRIPLSSA